MTHAKVRTQGYGRREGRTEDECFQQVPAQYRLPCASRLGAVAVLRGCCIPNTNISTISRDTTLRGPAQPTPSSHILFHSQAKDLRGLSRSALPAMSKVVFGTYYTPQNAKTSSIHRVEIASVSTQSEMCPTTWRKNSLSTSSDQWGRSLALGIVIRFHSLLYNGTALETEDMDDVSRLFFLVCAQTRLRQGYRQTKRLWIL
jgi:hypothetical protein